MGSVQYHLSSIPDLVPTNMLVLLLLPLVISASVPETRWRCPAQLTNCLLNDIEKLEDPGSWRACGQLCAANEDCMYWTYVSAPQNVAACYLKSACPVAWTDLNAWSGD